MATCPNSLVGQQCPQVTPARACSSVILYIWMPTSLLLKKKKFSAMEHAQNGPGRKTRDKLKVGLAVGIVQGEE